MTALERSDWATRTEFVLPPRRKDVRVHRLNEEAVLFDPDSRETYMLNETALLVWGGCDGRSTTTDLVRRLTDQYEIDDDSALDHVLQLAAHFAECRLIGEEPCG